MARYSWLAAAAAVALVGACASSGHDGMSADTMGGPAASARAPTTPPPPMHTPQAATYSDEQLRSFAAAASEIDPISRSLPSATDEQRTAATVQIREILQRNNIDAATYNAIAAQARSDPSFAARIRSLGEGG